MRERRGSYGFRWGYLKERENLEDLGIDARKYKQIFKK
jgi:hypothetical protein